MEKVEIKRALISCWDKTGLDGLAAGLSKRGIQIISSGGTARYLEKQGIEVVAVESLTGYPEMLDGRVKTLHPAIHAGILARRKSDHLTQLHRQNIQPIDLVVVNLYPFLDELERDGSNPDKMVELIDIGGPAMLRAAAKNFKYVAALHKPDQYPALLHLIEEHNGSIPVEVCRQWASEAFFYTAYYDSQISAYLEKEELSSELPSRFSWFFEKQNDLRYGENPHQSAALYRPLRKTTPAYRQLGGKEMSFNNFVDAEAAEALVEEFEQPAAAIIKHTNPCGVAVANELADAFRHALATDPLSAFGGIIALNRPLDIETAEIIKSSFFECVIAPDFEAGAVEILAKKKNLRLLQRLTPVNPHFQLKLLTGGILLQKADSVGLDLAKLQSVGAREPTDTERADLLFAWQIVKHVKSNAIVLVKNNRLLGVGAGQMSRVDSVKLACDKALAAGHELTGAVMASDAFFPFPDGVKKAAVCGISAVIQPGGSIRDEQVIEAAKQHGMAMLLTGIRHFKH